MAESDEDKAGVILDYDAMAISSRLRFLDASRRVTEAGKIECEAT